MDPQGGFSSPTAATTASRCSTRDGNFIAEWKQFGRPSGTRCATGCHVAD
jgi:hypothetical protein